MKKFAVIQAYGGDKVSEMLNDYAAQHADVKVLQMSTDLIKERYVEGETYITVLISYDDALEVARKTLAEAALDKTV